MKEKDIDSYLRENRPQIKDDPTFLLEVERKMRAVDGIKNEVDSQRMKGRLTMTAVFVAGIILGAIALAVVLTFPAEPEPADVSLLGQLKVYLEAHAEAFLVPVAFCAALISVALGTRKESMY